MCIHVGMYGVIARVPTQAEQKPVVGHGLGALIAFLVHLGSGRARWFGVGLSARRSGRDGVPAALRRNAMALSGGAACRASFGSASWRVALGQGFGSAVRAAVLWQTLGAGAKEAWRPRVRWAGSGLHDESRD